jgi:hypothetical protein
MRHCCFAIVLLTGWVSTVGQAPNTKVSQIGESTLPPVEVWNLLRSGDLSMVTRVEDLPTTVRGALAQVLHQPELEMGDRDHKVKVNAHCRDCMVFRLIFAGVSADGCIVHFSAIGLGADYEIIVFDTKKHKAHPLWAARGAGAHDLDELQSLIGEGKFRPFPIH